MCLSSINIVVSSNMKDSPNANESKQLTNSAVSMETQKKPDVMVCYKNPTANDYFRVLWWRHLAIDFEIKSVWLEFLLTPKRVSWINSKRHSHHESRTFASNKAWNRSYHFRTFIPSTHSSCLSLVWAFNEISFSLKLFKWNRNSLFSTRRAGSKLFISQTHVKASLATWTRFHYLFRCSCLLHWLHIGRDSKKIEL